MKQTILLALIAMMWVALPAQAAAQNRASTRTETTVQTSQPSTAKEVTAQTRVETREEKCQSAESKITFRLNQITQNRDRHYTTYQNIKSRMDGLISRWEGKGCDVSKLKTQRTQLETMLNEFAAAYRDIEASLKAAKQYQCGDNQGEFVSAAQAARNKNSVLKQKAIAIRGYVLNTIMPSLQTTKEACKPSPKPSASPSTQGGN